MTILHFEATAPVNPPDASPVLTQAQLWAGLQRKVRHANEFVPPITSCTVEKEEGNVVHRRVVFNGTKEMTEVCTELAPHKVEFTLEDGSEVENIIGSGPSGKADELYLTYSFKWKLPGVEDGSDEAKEALAKQQQMSAGAVTSSLAAIRAMVSDGRIKA
ncbi:hypothetical protein K4F52_002833 [Lecanicillium sp. MT-2017a]|nr:hypothetical protein K4F52_002833 [Lecanicillium sp. MT-2017a]